MSRRTLATRCVAAVALSTVLTAGNADAQTDGAAWVLASSTRESYPACPPTNPPGECGSRFRKNSFEGVEGNLVIVTSDQDAAGRWTGTARGTLTWDVPPARLKPGDQITMAVGVTFGMTGNRAYSGAYGFVSADGPFPTKNCGQGWSDGGGFRIVEQVAVGRPGSGSGKGVAGAPNPGDMKRGFLIKVCLGTDGQITSWLYRYEWRPSSTTDASRTPAPGAVTPTPTKPICPEAAAFFGMKPGSPSALRYSYDDLHRQFAVALAEYRRKGGRTADAGPPNRYGQAGALQWLASYGGASEDISWKYVFTTREEALAYQKRRGPRELKNAGVETDVVVRPGTELGLCNAIVASRNATGKRLTPGQVFGLALQQRNGNISEAMLLAHNTLRSLGRESSDKVFGPFGDRMMEQEMTRVDKDPAFFDHYIEPLVDGDPPSGGKNTGAWYHLFGTAYYELETTAEGLPTYDATLPPPTEPASTLTQIADLGAAAWRAGRQLVGQEGLQTHDATLRSPDVSTSAVATIAELGVAAWRAGRQVIDQDPALASSGSRSRMSEVANVAEQHARQVLGMQAPDPEKYCVNVWGAELAAAIAQRARRTNPFPALTTEEQRALARKEEDTPKALRWLLWHSPLNITWTCGARRMTFDQRSGSIGGQAVGAIVPVWDEASASWGGAWLAAADRACRVDIEASGKGAAHVTSIDSASGRAVAFPMRLATGDTFALDLSGRDVAMTGGAGLPVSPIVLAGSNIAGRPAAPPPPTPPPDPTAAPPESRPPAAGRALPGDPATYGTVTRTKRRDLFLDEFQDNSRGWSVASTPQASSAVRDGLLALEARADTTHAWWHNTTGVDDSRDFEVEASIRFSRGTALQGQNLVWGRSPGGEFNQFGFTGAGAYGIIVTSGGTFRRVVPWTTSDLVRRDEFNTLTVRKVGDTDYFFVNGTLVHLGPHLPLFGGQVGFLVGKQSSIEVDYLRVSLIE